MPGKVILGAQWGDEGTGKFIDIFAAQADLVVRLSLIHISRPPS